MKWLVWIGLFVSGLTVGVVGTYYYLMHAFEQLLFSLMKVG